jgi:hypothetical protein
VKRTNSPQTGGWSTLQMELQPFRPSHRGPLLIPIDLTKPDPHDPAFFNCCLPFILQLSLFKVI